MTQQQFITTVYKNEDQFTAAVHSYVNHNYPQLRNMYFHVANESATSLQMRLKLSSMGVLAGCPDFCFIYPVLFFIELKIPNGTLSPKQKALHEIWKSKGIIIEVCYNPETVIEVLTKYILLK